MKNAKLTFHKFEQRSKEWREIRLGRVGGSEAIGLTTAARMKTIIPLKMAEIETQEDQGDDFTSEAMKEGILNEPIVKAEYEKRHFVSVDDYGYITNSDFHLLGISPDGMVGSNGAIEIKCPQPKAHIEFIIEGLIPSKYRPQVSHLFFVVPDLEWVDFISYNEKVTRKPYFEIRVTREGWKAEIEKISKGYTSFIKKMQEADAKLAK